MPRFATATSVVAGHTHSCARLTDGSLKCWGDNFFGELGLEDQRDRGDNPGEMGASLPAVNLGPGRTATTVSLGESYTCAILDDRTVKCWGWGSYGALGLGDATVRGDGPGEMGAALPVVDLGQGRTAKALGTGGIHTCAILDNGTVKCWGDNFRGALGLGDMNDRGNDHGQMGASLPSVALGPGRTAKALGLGNDHTCAILDDDTIKCWGRNYSGQLGLGDMNDRGDGPNEMGANLPRVDLGPGRTAKALSAGDMHTCAILDNDAVKCWGGNSAGQLGLGDANDRGDTPNEMGANLPAVDLGPGRTAKALSAGGFQTCAVLDNGTVKCWGDNDFGRLGLGDTAYRGDGPNEMGANLPAVDLGPGRTAQRVSAGAFHTCALLDNGAIKCWGENSGRLGLGDTRPRGSQPGEMGANLPAVDLGP